MDPRHPANLGQPYATQSFRPERQLPGATAFPSVDLRTSKGGINNGGINNGGIDDAVGGEFYIYHSWSGDGIGHWWV